MAESLVPTQSSDALSIMETVVGDRIQGRGYHYSIPMFAACGKQKHNAIKKVNIFHDLDGVSPSVFLCILCNVSEVPKRKLNAC